MEPTQINIEFPKSVSLLLTAIFCTILAMGIWIVHLTSQQNPGIVAETSSFDSSDEETDNMDEDLQKFIVNTERDLYRAKCHDRLTVVGSLDANISVVCDDGARLERVIENSNSVFLCRCQ